MDRAAKLKYMNDRNKKVFKERLAAGLCRQCGDDAVLCTFSHNGKTIKQKRATYCPKHWDYRKAKGW